LVPWFCSEIYPSSNFPQSGKADHFPLFRNFIHSSEFFSYFTTRLTLPLMIDKSSSLGSLDNLSSDSIAPYFSIDMPPIMGVTSSLVLAFVV